LIQILRINAGIAGPQRLVVAKPVPVNRARVAQTASKTASDGTNAVVRIEKSGDLAVPALYRALTLSRGSKKIGRQNKPDQISEVYHAISGPAMLVLGPDVVNRGEPDAAMAAHRLDR
jgi:hypothetical protein